MKNKQQTTKTNIEFANKSYLGVKNNLIFNCNCSGGGGKIKCPGGGCIVIALLN